MRTLPAHCSSYTVLKHHNHNAYSACTLFKLHCAETSQSQCVLCLYTVQVTLCGNITITMRTLPVHCSSYIGLKHHNHNAYSACTLFKLHCAEISQSQFTMHILPVHCSS